jgi:hypothetical protein
VPRELLTPRSICIHFVPHDGISIQALDMDHRTMLGPYVRMQSAETLCRLLAYLGGTPAPSSLKLDDCTRRCGQLGYNEDPGVGFGNV